MAGATRRFVTRIATSLQMVFGMMQSVARGKCGPCCSMAPTGTSMAGSFLSTRAAYSDQLILNSSTCGFMAIPGRANAALKLSFSSCLLAPRNGIGAHIIAQHTDAALALEHRTVDALREQELQG